MFVAKLYEKKTGRTLLNYYEARRVNGKPKQFFVERIGYVDEFENLYPDPIAHFREEAKKKSKEAKVSLELSLLERFNFDSSFDKANEDNSLQKMENTISYGMLPLSKLYHELEIDYFINNRRRYTKAKFNHNSIFQMLVYGRILFPDSKFCTWQNKERLLGKMDFTDDDVYRSLEFFTKHKTALIQHLDHKVKELYGRDTTLMYYDVTNYYWEVDEEDDLRKRGVSKEHRPEPIVQMGLLMDEQSIPITYKLFPGNTNDCMTLSPVIGEVSEELRKEGVIYVADKGMMSGDNKAEIIINDGGYVISNSIRGTGVDKKTKDWILDSKGYAEYSSGNFKYKSRINPIKIWVTNQATGKKVEETINETQVAFWSKDYKERAVYERTRAIEKAFKNGSVLNNHAANKYFKKEAVDPDTGEIIKNVDLTRSLDETMIAEDAQYDGYYLICSNVVGTVKDEPPFKGKSRFRKDNLLELNKEVTAQDIIEIYKGLWRIEESFKITKSCLKTRPIFVKREDSIEAHFLSCFISLLLLRLLEKRTDNKIPVSQIVESLRKANLIEITPDLYKNSYCDNVIQAIGQKLRIDLIRKNYTTNSLKDMLAWTKKSST